MTHTYKRADVLIVGDTLLWRDMAVMKDIEHVVTAIAQQSGGGLRVTVAPHGVTADKVTWVLYRDEEVKIKVDDGH